MLASGTRVELKRAARTASWGYAGLGKRAEEDKNRAYHDLEVGARERGRLRARRRARRQMNRKPAERPEQEQLSLTLPAKRQVDERPQPAASTPSPAAPASAPASTLPSPAATLPRRQRRAGGAAPAQPRIYVVSELLKAVRLTLESRFTDVRVEGEVSGLKRSGNGHVYFYTEGRRGASSTACCSRARRRGSSSRSRRGWRSGAAGG